MIDKADVIEFFDRCAPSWDAGLIRSDRKINIILDNAGVREGSRVLDVACGTGVLMPDYLSRGAEVTGIDISPEMIKLAEQKYAGTGVRFICGDVEAADVGQDFDAIVVYNAFPHFPDPAGLIRRLSGLLRPGGRLSIAHGMSRAALDAHHSGSAHAVSMRLLPEEEVRALMAPYLDVDVVISDDRMYQVCGVKRA